MRASEMTSADKAEKLVDIIIDLADELTIARNAFTAKYTECGDLRNQLSDAKENERALLRKCRVYESILDEHGIDYSGEFAHE